MQTLTYNQRIRLATWTDTASATVFTVRGYAIASGRDADQMERNAAVQGHALVGSIYSGGALVGDRAYAARLLAEAKANAAGAATLAQDEVVAIDGRHYKVRVARGNAGPFPVNSDPIHFIPVNVVDIEGIDDALRDEADRRAMEAQCFPATGG